MVAAHGVPVGDGSPPCRGLTGWESSPAGGYMSRCTCGQLQPRMAPAHRLGGTGSPVQPSWLQLTVRRKGMATPNGAGSQAGGGGIQPSRWLQVTVRFLGTAALDGAGSQGGGTDSPAKLLLACQGAPVGHGKPQWRRLTGWGDRDSSLVGGCRSRCACGGRVGGCAHCVFFNTLLHCLGQRAVGLYQYSATLHVAVGSVAPSVHYRTAVVSR